MPDIIKSKDDIQRAFNNGHWKRHPLLSLLFIDGQSCGESIEGRVAFLAGKKIGNAVCRNKSKRLLREAFRACEIQEFNEDLIFVATKHTRFASLKDITHAMQDLLKKAGVQCVEKNFLNT